MSAREFGSILCGLLNAAEANPRRLAALARQVRLRPGADALLRGARNVYLVSSGPDYFVRWLAKRYRVSTRRVLCSQYVFDSRQDRFVGCVSIVGEIKKRFVQQEAGKYQVSIGVGDDPQRDAGFMSACDLSVGFGAAWEGLRTSDLNQVVDIVRTVRRFGTWCGRARHAQAEDDPDEGGIDPFETFDDEDLGRSGSSGPAGGTS